MGTSLGLGVQVLEDLEHQLGLVSVRRHEELVRGLPRELGVHLEDLEDVVVRKPREPEKFRMILDGLEDLFHLLLDCLLSEVLEFLLLPLFIKFLEFQS